MSENNNKRLTRVVVSNSAAAPQRRCLRSPSSCSLPLGTTLTMQRAQAWRPGSAVAFKNVPFSICPNRDRKAVDM